MKSNDNKFHDLCFKKVFFFSRQKSFIFALEWPTKSYKTWSLSTVDSIISYLKIVSKRYFDTCFNRFKRNKVYYKLHTLNENIVRNNEVIKCPKNF